MVAVGVLATGGSPIDVAECHLVDPALAAVGAQHEPVHAALLEQLDLVALVEERRARCRAARRGCPAAERGCSGSAAVPGRRSARPDRGRTSGAGPSTASRIGSALRASSSDGRRQRGMRHLGVERCGAAATAAAADRRRAPAARRDAAGRKVGKAGRAVHGQRGWRRRGEHLVRFRRLAVAPPLPEQPERERRADDPGGRDERRDHTERDGRASARQQVDAGRQRGEGIAAVSSSANAAGAATGPGRRSRHAVIGR